jgi:KaiC/GvpD/RAD55 family RecA-like ATPase
MTKLVPCIAPVCYRDPADIVSEGQMLKVIALKKAGNSLHWLDELCRGSIGIPSDLDSDAKPRGRSIIMLISGPPGTGKTTFALELSCSLANQEIIETNIDNETRKLESRVFFVSAEESGKRVKDKAEANGWIKTNSCPVTVLGTPPNTKVESGLVIKGRDAFNLVPGQPPDIIEDLSSPFRDVFADVMVLDSLNMYSANYGEQNPKITKFNEIQNQIANPVASESKNPRLIIIVVDTTGKRDEELQYCEYCADIVFHFGWEEKLGYTMRTFEIIKMRGQSHAWGKQRVKIYPRESHPREKGAKGKLTSNAREQNAPYFKEKAGIYIFPSMHTYISHFTNDKALKAANPACETLGFPEHIYGINTQIASAKELQGIPAAGCTAIVGRRGAMKSHLAYYFLLAHASGILTSSNIKNEKSQELLQRNCLLVSLRDDQEGAIQTLSHIAASQGLSEINGLGSGFEGGRKLVIDLIKKDRLEILENDIGMISPEEFFHKIYVAVHRLRNKPGVGQKRSDAAVQVVLVSGLDQLEARFPLIAQESMFVPALIQLLRWNKVCSIMASALGESTTSSGENLYGLLPMADLILDLELVNRHNPPDGYHWPSDFPKELWPVEIQQIARVETRRVPGGQIGSKFGYLYRTPDGKLLYAA